MADCGVFTTIVFRAKTIDWFSDVNWCAASSYIDFEVILPVLVITSFSLNLLSPSP